MATNSPSQDSAYTGAARLPTGSSDFNVMDFIVRQILGKSSTATLVQIVAVTSAGEIAGPSTVDVHPMVAQIDGKGNATPHGVIHNVPYVRIQGGANAIIIDPVVGDIGIAIFAGQDISSVKVNKAPSLPGSRRRFDLADALYVGGVLNGIPTQYLRYFAGGIEIVSAGAVNITAPSGLAVTGNVTVTGMITAMGDVTAMGTSLHTHKHSGVSTGSGQTGMPV